MKFCTQCGTKLEDVAVFCKNCGVKLPSLPLDEVDVTLPQPSHSPNDNAYEKVPTWKKIEMEQSSNHMPPISQPKVAHTENRVERTTVNPYVKKCIACGNVYSADHTTCPDCGIVLGAPFKLTAGELDEAKRKSAASARNNALFGVLIVLALSIMGVGLLLPMFSVLDGKLSISFWDMLMVIGQSGAAVLDSTFTWMGVFAVVPAFLLLIGSILRNKAVCVTATVIGCLGSLLMLLVFMGALDGTFVDPVYLFSEDGPLGLGFWGSWIGHGIAFVCSLMISKKA